MVVPRGLTGLLIIATCLCNCRSTFADVECTDGKIYSDCGTACPKTCMGEPEMCTLSCVQGCFCPEETVLDSDGKCVQKQQCGCLYDADGNGQKEYYKLGESFDNGIGHKDQCQCHGDGEVTCTRR